MGAEKTPWVEIKTKYITGRQSCKKLAEEYGIRPKLVSERCRKEKWVLEREQYRENTGKKAVAQASHAQARELAGLIRASDRMVEELEKVLEDADQFYRHLDTDSMEIQVLTKADTKAMRNIASALREMTAVMRDLHGSQRDKPEAARIELVGMEEDYGE